LKTTSWKDLAELVGIAAIVASLIFVGLELQQSRAVALAEVHQSRAQIGMQFSAWPRDPSVEVVRRKELAGEPLDSFEQLISDSVYDEVLYFIENNYYQYQLGLLPQEIWDANIRAMAAWIPFDENFDDYWLRKRHEWNVSFAPVIDEYVEVSQSRGDR
jgi:hypothetical protein